MNTETMIKIFGLTPYEEAGLKDIMRNEMKFIDSEDFHADDAEIKLFDNAETLPKAARWKNYESLTSKDSKANILLSREQENLIFSQYNFARFRVATLKADIVKAPKKSTILEAIKWRKKALDLREEIVGFNMRLVVNLVKKYSIYKIDMDDMYSEAHWSLLAAIDGFDINRGQKFSTYAYWVVIRSFGKLNRDRSKNAAQMDNGDLENADLNLSGNKHSKENMLYIEVLRRVLDENLANLTELELDIIKARYLHHGKRPSIAEVGTLLNEKNYRVSKCEKSGLRKIKKVIEQEV